MTSISKLFYYSHQKAEALKGVQAVLVFPSWRSWSLVTQGGCRMSVVLRQFARNWLHCFKLFHSYTSHLELLRHMIYTPFWLVLMVYQAVSYQKFTVTCSLKLVDPEEDSWLQQASLYAQEYTWSSKLHQGEWCQLVYCSWDSHIKLRLSKE